MALSRGGPGHWRGQLSAVWLGGKRWSVGFSSFSMVWEKPALLVVERIEIRPGSVVTAANPSHHRLAQVLEIGKHKFAMVYDKTA